MKSSKSKVLKRFQVGDKADRIKMRPGERREYSNGGIVDRKIGEMKYRHLKKYLPENLKNLD